MAISPLTVKGQRSFSRRFVGGILESPSPFPNGVRVGSLDEELLRLMERAGCYILALGIESGVDETLSRMKKSQTTAQVRKVVKLIRLTTSIQVTGFFIMGYPGESLSDVKKTIRFAVNLPIHHAHFCLFIPIPGTPIYNELQEKGHIPPEGWESEHLTIDSPSFSLPGLPARKLLHLHQYAYIRFYSKPWRILNLLRLLKRREQLGVILRRFIKLFR
jgi:anaerobic magnesium-protoporphyrin IX monomethyl ester cyclase